MAWEKAPQADGSKQWAKFQNEGDSVEGEIVDLNLESGAQTYDGIPCGYVQLKPDAGEEIRLGLDKKMIADQVIACEPKVGDRLRVDFTGWRTSEKSGRQYKFYEVFIDRTSGKKAGFDEEGFTESVRKIGADTQQGAAPVEQHVAPIIERERDDSEDDLPF